jgi:hypothetical protein
MRVAKDQRLRVGLPRPLSKYGFWESRPCWGDYCQVIASRGSEVCIWMLFVCPEGP